MENRESAGEYVRCVLGNSVSAFRVEAAILLLSYSRSPSFYLSLFLSSMLYIIQLASFDLARCLGLTAAALLYALLLDNIITPGVGLVAVWHWEMDVRKEARHLTT